MKKSIIVIASGFFILFSFNSLYAVSKHGNKKLFKLKELGFFTGYMEGSIIAKEDYQLIPAGIKLGIDLKHLGKTLLNSSEDIDFRSEKHIWELIIEPYVGNIISPDANLETGFGLLLKYGYKFGKFMPFLQCGTGFQYMTQHIRDQGTQWNFQVQGSAGISYFFKENTAINFEYRYRHFSNASLDDPNRGVDLQGSLLGLSYFF